MADFRERGLNDKEISITLITAILIIFVPFAFVRFDVFNFFGLLPVATFCGLSPVLLYRLFKKKKLPMNTAGTVSFWSFSVFPIYYTAFVIFKNSGIYLREFDKLKNTVIPLILLLSVVTGIVAIIWGGRSIYNYLGFILSFYTFAIYLLWAYYILGGSRLW